MSSFPGQSGETRQCVHCGKPISIRVRQCPFCREPNPEIPRPRPLAGPGGRLQIRRGLLYMLLAGVIYYFSGGYSAFTLPISVNSAVNNYLAPLLFLGGVGLTLYGVYLRYKS
jgi:hypothetical protein